MKHNRQKELSRRLQAIHQVAAYRAAGMSQEVACRCIGIAASQVSLWRKRYEAGGAEALVPQERGGRPRSLVLTAEETAFFQRKVIDHGSIPVAAEELWRDAATTPATRRALAVALSRAEAEGRRQSWPVALLEAAQIPKCLEALHRGRKHARAFEPKARRDGSVEVDGVRMPWQPGFIYESDDMSLNEPFRFTDSSLRRETAGRQGIFTIDAAAQFHMGKTLIGRARDAYRMEDVADHMLNIVTDHGLPLMWRLEKGIFASSLILGITPKGHTEKWGSMEDLFYVRTKHESTGKANIERSFNEQQKRSAHKSTSIGRERGEFEKATKLYAKAQEGRAEALQYFWTIDEAGAWIDDALRSENHRARRYEKTGFYGTPEELMAARQTRRVLRDEERWYFMPIKRQVSVRKGVVEIKVDHYPRSFRFILLGDRQFPVFDEGHSVLVAFHPGRAEEEGCYIFNAQQGVKAKGMKFAQFLGKAEFFRDVAEEVIGGDGGNFSQIERGKGHMRSDYRGIVPAGTGPGTLKSTARDGMGNALTVQIGGNVPQADGVVLPPKPAREIVPAVSSRPLPAGVTRAEEIARLRARLEEAEC